YPWAAPSVQASPPHQPPYQVPYQAPYQGAVNTLPYPYAHEAARAPSHYAPVAPQGPWATEPASPAAPLWPTQAPVPEPIRAATPPFPVSPARGPIPAVAPSVSSLGGQAWPTRVRPEVTTKVAPAAAPQANDLRGVLEALQGLDPNTLQALAQIG